MRGILGNGACHGVRSDPYRDGIRFRGSVQIANLNEPELRGVRVGGNRKLLDHLQLPKCSSLGTEPTAVADIRGQNFALQLFALTIVKQDLQLGRRFERWHNAFLQRTASVGRRLQRKPVIRMRAERDDVARFPDRPK